MDFPAFNADQLKVINYSLNRSIFLEGTTGSGKTTAAVGRLSRLLKNFPGKQILIITPQRSLAKPYYDFLIHNDEYRGGLPTITTISGLARDLIIKFWPMISKTAGFGKAAEKPHFLSTETAQYCMSLVAAPFLDRGYFQSIVIEKSRLFSQLLDNLNKSAVIPFPAKQIAERLKNVSNLDASIQNAYDQAQECILVFRSYCQANNLIDFSLMIEILTTKLWTLQNCREYFYSNYKVIIVDNVEEDVPVSHDLIGEWIKHFESSLIIYDEGAGYRSFLGADPQSALSLKNSCEEIHKFNSPFNQSRELENLKSCISDCINHSVSREPPTDLSPVLSIKNFHFYPEMIADVCREIYDLVNMDKVEPQDIVILSPYLSDVLKFSLTTRLEDYGIRTATSRPSRMYIQNPVVHALLCFSKLAHPEWEMKVTGFELRHALMSLIPELDIARADLVIKTLFADKGQPQELRSFDSITNILMQERITFVAGEKLEKIRIWMVNYFAKGPQPLDVFISQFYGELVSQKGFKLFADYESANSVSQIISSIRSFRHFLTSFIGFNEISSGIEYIRTVEDGLLPASIIENDREVENVLLIEPAHTFLMENRSCAFQFWLDIGSMGWWERLNQPLTNPYLLRRAWGGSQKWTDAFEFEANQESMLRIIRGLLSRCTRKIIVNTVHTNEYGSEQRGPLLRAFQLLQKQIYRHEVDRSV